MVGIDFQAPEGEDSYPASHDPGEIKLSISLDEDPAPAAASENSQTDQIVKIDFSSLKTSSDEALTVAFEKSSEPLRPEKPAAVSRRTTRKISAADAKSPVLAGAAKYAAPAPLPPFQPRSGGSTSEILDDLTRAAQENQRQLSVIAGQIDQIAAVLPKLDTLQRQFEHSNKLEAVNQKLFDTMHGELKGYKDGFLFDSLQKPVTRDLLVLFDDLCGQSRRMARFISENNLTGEPDDPAKKWSEELRAARENVNNTVHFLMEIFNRMAVVMEDGQHDVLDLKLHKVVGIEVTTLAQEQNSIVKVVRPGFYWRERLIRPTEVIVRKLSTNVRKSGKS